MGLFTITHHYQRSGFAFDLYRVSGVNMFVKNSHLLISGTHKACYRRLNTVTGDFHSKTT